ncbi:MAG: prolyl oligopeptidase family serine peptidase [Pseudomonadota bacterium]
MIRGFSAAFSLALLLLAAAAQAQDDAASSTAPAVAEDGGAVEAAPEDAEPTVRDYFRAIAIQFVRISPDGQRLAYVADNRLMAGSIAEGFHALKKFSANDNVSQYEWIGPSHLMVRLQSSNSRRATFAAFTVETKDGELVAGETQVFEAFGRILDPLPDDPAHVLFINSDVKDGNAFANVYRLNAFKEARTQLGEADRLNKSFNRASWFVLDQNKKLFLALDTWGSAPRLYQRSAGGTKWTQVWSGPADAQFYPVRLSRDEKKLYVLTDATTDRLVAAEFDLEAGKIGRIIHEDPITDVEDLVMSDRSGEPVAVVVTRDGLLDYVFFDAELERNLAAAAGQFEDSSLIITDLAASDASAVVYASSQTNSGTFYFCVFADVECGEIGPVRPWLEGEGLAATNTIEVPSTDGHTVFAFVTLPVDAGDDKVPLIVMPHGGPIGVSDDRHYSPDVQWLARNGYAVLRVNYRGSSGYGKEFMSAGMRQWGRGIEDDIEAATDLALARYERLDGERVCIYGASYGGYSALQSLVRSPERYRCAASFAGVSDLPLMFSRSVFRRDETLRELLIDMVGDPNLDLQELRDYSPVYNYRKISKPVFLAHGTADSRVDIEHSWRLERLLQMVDADVEMLALDDVGHGFTTLDEVESFYTPLLAFLDRHLRETPQ